MHKNYYKKTLIISPHSDDEIFTLPFIYSPENSFNEIDLLLLERDSKRYKESFDSCKFHRFNLITLSKDINLKGLHFYENLEDLIECFLNLQEKYDLILSPMIEGGHQDHDTVCLAILYCKKYQKSQTKLILYSTYRSQDFIPILYTCGISRKISKEKIISVSLSYKWIYLYLITIIIFYRSQYKTWILLTPFVLFLYLNGNLNKFVNGNYLDYKAAIKLIPEKPLYQTYRNCPKKKWLAAHNLIIEN